MQETESWTESVADMSKYPTRTGFSYCDCKDFYRDFVWDVCKTFALWVIELLL